MRIPLRLLVPARFRRSAPPARPQPGPPPVAIDFAAIEEPVDLDATEEIPIERLEWLRARARVA